MAVTFGGSGLWWQWPLVGVVLQDGDYCITYQQESNKEQPVPGLVSLPLSKHPVFIKMLLLKCFLPFSVTQSLFSNLLCNS